MPDKTTKEVLEEFHLDPECRPIVYLSHSILRKIQDLEILCFRYPDDHLISPVVDEGNTGFLLSATEENCFRTLRWFQDHEDSIHQPNHYGRTSLMEEALWGRSQTVQYLSQQSIDLEARDGDGMQAVDLAANT